MGEALIFAVAGTVAYVQRHAIAEHVASSGPGPFKQPLTRDLYEKGVIVAAIGCWGLALAFLLGLLS